MVAFFSHIHVYLCQMSWILILIPNYRLYVLLKKNMFITSTGYEYFGTQLILIDREKLFRAVVQTHWSWTTTLSRIIVFNDYKIT